MDRTKSGNLGRDGIFTAPQIPIAGSHNLRDLGGYRTEEGREVKHGLLFRSGVMHQLSDSDRAAFRRLGISVIYDLRANEERAKKPTRWHEGESIAYHTRDYEMSIGALDELMRRGEYSTHAVRDMIHVAYRDLPFEQAESYRQLFALLAAGNVPLLFNCTAGKDRTGIAAALILFALGVPRATIEHDYALTEREIEKLMKILFSDARYAPLAGLPRETYLPLFRADPHYLAIAFTEMEQRYGSIQGYLADELGVGARQTAALRDLLLTAPV